MTTRNLHASGTPCNAATPKSCPFYKEEHVPLGNSQQVSAALDTVITAAPRYQLPAFEKGFRKWVSDLKKTGDSPDEMQSVVPFIDDDTLPPVYAYNRVDGSFSVIVAGTPSNGDHYSSDNHVQVPGKTIEEVRANALDPHSNIKGDAAAVAKVRSYFAEEPDAAELLTRKSPNFNAFHSVPERQTTWNMPYSTVVKLGLYGKDIQKRYSDFDEKDQAVILANTLSRHEGHKVPKFVPGEDNKEYAKVVGQLWSSYKDFLKPRS